MHHLLKTIPVAALAAAVVTLASLEGHKGASAKTTSCEAVRRDLRQSTLKAWGYDLFVSQMKRISRELTPEERNDLKRLTATLDAPNANPNLKFHAARMIKKIYGAAIERSGLQRSVPELHKDPRLAITASPTGSDPMLDGYTVVLGSSLHAPATAPQVGDITDALLAVNADQSDTRLILVRATQVTPNAQQGYDTEGELVSLQQVVDARAPRRCAAEQVASR